MSRPEDIPQDVWDTARAAHSKVSMDPRRSAAAHIARAIMAEREACASLSEKAHASPPPPIHDRGDAYAYAVSHGAEIAAAIRKRGEG